jgi:hypothetical protein
MGVSLFTGGSGTNMVKSIQRGEALAAGDVTITEVNTATTSVNSFSTSASGSAGASGTIAGATGDTGSRTINSMTAYAAGYQSGAGSSNTYDGRYSVVNWTLSAANLSTSTGTLNSQSITGGTTDLTMQNYGAYIKNSTTITVTGPCRWEVIEYY